MLKSVVLASVAVASLTAFATGASAQSSTSPILGNGTTANESFVLQRGNNNNATVNQTGTNVKAGSLTNQVDLTASKITEGDANYQFQYANTVLQNGSGNDLTITQAGTNNQVVTTNGNLDRYDFSFNPNNGSFSAGDGNSASVTQKGTNGQAQFQQRGNRNQATITVDSSVQNTYAGIFQDGNDNKPGIYQHD